MLVIWSVLLVTAVVLYFRRTYTLFSSQGVKQFSPIPLLGDMTRILLRQEHFAEQMERMYKAYPGERFVGRYEFANPMLIVCDIETLKRIAVTDFEHFLDHRTLINEKTNPLFGRNLICLKGQEWKDMRSTLSPAFTSSKIKLIVPFMVEVGEQMIQALRKKVADSGRGYIDIDCKDLTTRYANDVIASCAFGLKVDSMTQEQNEFYLMAKTASTFNFKQMLKFFGFIAFPKIMDALKITLFTEEVENFFKNLVMNTMNDRETRNIVRPDMINILMEARKEWSDEDLIAQVVFFFVGAFESISSAMSFFIHEIAVNSDVQERLYQEIIENEAKNGGKLDYNSIQDMVYMDMVVSEVLRLWPPAVFSDRLCTKDYIMGKPNDKAEKDFILRKGISVSIPIWAIHRDPDHFQNPEKFDPERFSEENKHNIKPFTYIPFGLGPRSCIGSRFVLCEVKVMAYKLLQHMEIYPCEKTCMSAKLDYSTFSIRLEGGHWVRMKVRQ